jgi:hypothetical protein
MKIYTKTGDEGETGLFAGPRVWKNDLRIEAYGVVDELNAFLGWGRAQTLPPEIDSILERIQHDLFAVGAELATVDPQRHGMDLIGEEHITVARAGDRSLGGASCRRCANSSFREGVRPARPCIWLAACVGERNGTWSTSGSISRKSPNRYSATSIGSGTCCLSWRAPPITTWESRIFPGRNRSAAVRAIVRRPVRAQPPDVCGANLIFSISLMMAPVEGSMRPEIESMAWTTCS